MEELPERNASQPEPEDRPDEAGQETAVAAENPAAQAAEPTPVERTAEEQQPTMVEPTAEGEELTSIQAVEPTPAQPETAVVETAETLVGTTEVAEAPAREVDEPAEAPAAAETAEPTETGEAGEPAMGIEQPAAQAAPEAEDVKAEEQAATPAPTRPAGPRLADLKAGMVMEGTVTRIERYGAFVNLGLVERRDGLIHISELSTYRVHRVEDVVKVGDQVRARVVSVDLAKGRIGLSLNDVPMEDYAEAQSASSEPALTAMQLAFERAYGRRREDEKQGQPGAARGNLGDRKKREHEELMRKLQSGS